MHQTIPVLVIDDNRVRRDVLVALLEATADIRVVAAPDSADAAMRHLQDDARHVVLVAADLANSGSCQAVERVRHAAPGVRVIVMGVHSSRDDIIGFVEAGASGFVVADASGDEVVTTVRSVGQGDEVLPPAIAGSLFSHISGHASGHVAAHRGTVEQMTKREREVIHLIATGLTNREIAARLNLSAHTVKSHVRNIMEKLALHTRLQIAAFTHHAGDAPAEPGEPPAN